MNHPVNSHLPPPPLEGTGSSPSMAQNRNPTLSPNALTQAFPYAPHTTQPCMHTPMHGSASYKGSHAWLCRHRESLVGVQKASSRATEGLRGGSSGLPAGGHPGADTHLCSHSWPEQCKVLALLLGLADRCVCVCVCCQVPYSKRGLNDPRAVLVSQYHIPRRS